MVRYVLIQCDPSLPLRTLSFHPSSAEGCGTGTGGDDGGGLGDRMPSHLLSSAFGGGGGGGGHPVDAEIDVTPLLRVGSSPRGIGSGSSRGGDGGRDEDGDYDSDGVYVYSLTTFSDGRGGVEGGVYGETPSGTAAAAASEDRPNVRATSLAMACGLHARRFRGDVCVGRLGYGGGGAGGAEGTALRNKDLDADEVRRACASPDLRFDLYSSSSQSQSIEADAEEEEVAGSAADEAASVPRWMADAAKRNYEDSASLSALASVMTTPAAGGGPFRDNEEEEDDTSDDDDYDGSSGDGSAEEDDSIGSAEGDDGGDGDGIVGGERGRSLRNLAKGGDEAPTAADGDARRGERKECATLCLHCRGPCESLCPGCGAAYFCEEPRRCRRSGWSHGAVCRTWRVYNERRGELSDFPTLDWNGRLTGRPFQISDEPYRSYLRDELRVLGMDDDDDDNDEGKGKVDDSSSSAARSPSSASSSSSWWTTEVDGWSAGRSDSARSVDASVRRTYREGFGAALTNGVECDGGDPRLVPPERRATEEDVDRSGLRRDGRGLLVLDSWGDYYALRDVSPSSPIALLCTFPLTVYYAIQRFGPVPVTVSRMLNRPLRIHCVGIEKEMNFLDLFKEVGFLLPEDLKVEMTFVVRGDMIPEASRGGARSRGYELKLDLLDNLALLVQSGTYGDDVDPNFDCGSGPPDMIVGINAGLFAYESWRSVVSYLDANRGVVGVFTDYNEHSGVNCASLGGGEARESLGVNPFRQPRAMPVYCMNLPQFSNGFVYVYNRQELD